LSEREAAQKINPFNTDRGEAMQEMRNDVFRDLDPISPRELAVSLAAAIALVALVAMLVQLVLPAPMY
jgi:hypothetical protein